MSFTIKFNSSVLESNSIQASNSIVNRINERVTQDNSAGRIKNVDTFNYVDRNNINNAAYTKEMLINHTDDNLSISTNSVEAVSLEESSNDTNPYYDVITNRAAKNANISLNSYGTPIISNQTDASAYSSALSEIRGRFWCQTGGWFGAPDYGSNECARTAVATMASINMDTTIAPTNITSGVLGVTVNDILYERNGYTASYDFDTGAQEGLTLYDFNNSSDLLDAINNELYNNRSVVLKVNKGASQHWVTITGTIDGNPAESFSDLEGVDPWYNASNSNNAGESSKTSAYNSEYSGVFNISDDNTIHTDYRFFAFKG